MPYVKKEVTQQPPSRKTTDLYAVRTSLGATSRDGCRCRPLAAPGARGATAVDRASLLLRDTLKELNDNSKPDEQGEKSPTRGIAQARAQRAPVYRAQEGHNAVRTKWRTT